MHIVCRRISCSAPSCAPRRRPRALVLCGLARTTSLRTRAPVLYAFSRITSSAPSSARALCSYGCTVRIAADSRGPGFDSRGRFANLSAPSCARAVRLLHKRLFLSLDLDLDLDLVPSRSRAISISIDLGDRDLRPRAFSAFTFASISTTISEIEIAISTSEIEISISISYHLDLNIGD